MRRKSILTSAAALLAAALLAAGCQEQRFDLDAETIEHYRTRAMAEAAGPLAGPQSVARAWSASQPATQPANALVEYEGARTPGRTVSLSLQDAIRRALAHSLDIKVESYSPAVSATDIAAAQAAFDAVLFLESKWSKLDQPANSTFFTGGRSEELSISPGIRKPLATGGQISASLAIDHTINNQPRQRFNSFYNDVATLQLTQPLLRNFGVEVNRAKIYVARNNRNISLFAFRRKVIDTLAAVEQAYWNLFFARQSLAIQRELLAQTEKTYNTVEARKELDATPPIIAQTLSAVATRRASVSQLASEVQDAEDRLKNLLDDPDLAVGQDVAIVPADEPLTQPVELDGQRELWTALENRGELHEARLGIANANIVRGVARNLLLPKLDAFFQWNVNSLGGNFPDANRQAFRGDFQDWVVGLTFEFPLGNREAEAGLRKTQLQLEQAVANYHNLAGGVMTEVEIALRGVRTSFTQIREHREAVLTSEDTLAKLEARVTGLTPEFLDLRLRTQEAVAQARRALHQAVANYNNAIVALERAKGTLLRYDRVELAPESSGAIKPP